MDAAASASASIVFPPYPWRHSGTAIICGFANTLHDDLDAALRIRPDAKIIAVNQAMMHVEAFAGFSLHHGYHKLGDWALRALGNPTIHSKCNRDELEAKREGCPWVHHWWPEAGGVGTSAWGARRMAALMGFDEAILCGVTLERAPYATGLMARDFRHPKVLKIYRDFIRGNVAYHPGTYAMSGWPRRFFGPPPAKEPHP